MGHTTKSGSVRERLLEAAATRFYADGVNATGIDAITATAGVAKMSLYNNFSSKAALVEAYIDRRHRDWMDLYEARLTGAATPTEKVLAVFDAYVDHASSAYPHGFRGCGLLNAAAELPVGDPGRSAVKHHKEEVERILVAHLCTVVGQEQAEDLAEHMVFLLEGAMARAGLEGDASRLRRARAMAAQMLEGC